MIAEEREEKDIDRDDPEVERKGPDDRRVVPDPSGQLPEGALKHHVRGDPPTDDDTKILDLGRDDHLLPGGGGEEDFIPPGEGFGRGDPAFIHIHPQTGIP